METYTLQATGHLAFSLYGQLLGESIQMLDPDKRRRGVSLKIYKRDTGPEPFVVSMTYLTSWPQEREFTRIGTAANLEGAAQWARAVSATVLPPGAGYPATEDYRERQEKLRGQMQTLALDALTFALSQAAHQ